MSYLAFWATFRTDGVFAAAASAASSASSQRDLGQTARAPNEVAPRRGAWPTGCSRPRPAPRPARRRRGRRWWREGVGLGVEGDDCRRRDQACGRSRRRGVATGCRARRRRRADVDGAVLRPGALAVQRGPASAATASARPAAWRRFAPPSPAEPRRRASAVGRFDASSSGAATRRERVNSICSRKAGERRARARARPVRRPARAAACRSRAAPARATAGSGRRSRSGSGGACPA